MSTFPDTYVPRPMISTASPESLTTGAQLQSASTWSSLAWPSANRAYYFPMRLPHAITVTQLWVANGATASGNFDIGIYDDQGTKIISTGSTAQSGTNTIQAVNTTDTVIGPGAFFLALVMNGATGTVFRASTGSVRALFLGYYLQATAFALPATATFATTGTSNQFIPLFGLSTVVIV